ncbi:MAG: cell division protein ZapA [Bacteroidales bacterium]|nr:cell division protein ZapA [Candidatus Cacconaster merdequi]
MGQNITIKIAGKEFPLTVQPEEEETIRKAAAEVNGKIEALKFDYRGVDEDEILRIVMMMDAVQLLDTESVRNEQMSDLVGRLEELDTGLGEYLHSR